MRLSRSSIAKKDMIRLGAGIIDGRLPDANIAAALRLAGKIPRLAESHGVDEIIVAATSAVREAENGTELITQARRQLGLRVRVIPASTKRGSIHLAAAYAIGIGSVARHRARHRRRAVPRSRSAPRAHGVGAQLQDWRDPPGRALRRQRSAVQTR
jgi:hypothetical protein